MDSEKKVLDLDAIDAVDEGHMDVMVGGAPSGWIWTFCGPGDPRAVAQSNRVAREELARQRGVSRAQANGKKWSPPEQTPDEVRENNVNFVMERLTGWSEVTMGGEPFPFSVENARQVLNDRKKGALLQQAIEFIVDDNSFMKRSPTS